MDSNTENEKKTPFLETRNVYFGGQKVTCEKLDLDAAGFKFIRVKAHQDKPLFNIIIPPTDITQAGFHFDQNLSTLVFVTNPDSGTKICDALNIDPKSKVCPVKKLEAKPSTEGILRILVDFVRLKGEEILDTLTKYLTTFEDIDWTLNRLDGNSLRAHLNYLVSCSADSSGTEMSATKENEDTSPPPSLTASTRTYSSLHSPSGYSSSRHSISKTSASLLRPKVQNQRLRSNESPSIINIEIDDDDDDDETENLLNMSVPGSSCAGDIILNYPPNESDSITIYKRDLDCLEEGQYLTDTILGFYLKHIEKQLIEPSIAARTYIFSTFFYSKLTTKPRNEEFTSLPDKYFNRVKNWTKNANIFDKDFLIVPINKSYHWFVAIICYPKRVPDIDEILPIEIDKNPKKPCILFMDSLQCASTRNRLAEPIRHWLSREWEAKKGSKKNFSRNAIPDKYLKVPKQQNSSDCGLFVLQYIESFLRNPDSLLDRVSSVGLNHENWFSNSLVEAKRRSIKRLINKLSNEGRSRLSMDNHMDTDSS